MTKKKVTKYFEIKLDAKWKNVDYFFFLLESLYNNILPFFLGYIIAKTNLVWLVLLMILPVWINLSFQKKKKRTKKIYIK